MSESTFQGLTSWHSPWSGLRVLVVGLGHTGFAVVDTLLEKIGYEGIIFLYGSFSLLSLLYLLIFFKEE